MNRLLILLLLNFLTVNLLCGQIKSIGLPLIHNFKKADYHGDTQNWSLVQDGDGMIYAGNNLGILQFDGFEWQLFPVSNNSIVRSLELGNDGNIYVGAYNELGRLVDGPNGTKMYESLMPLVPQQYRDFDDVWKVYQTRYGIVFQSYEYLFIYQDEQFKVVMPASRFGFSYYINNTYYIIDKEEGLLMYDKGELEHVSDHEIFKQNEIRFILPFKSNAVLVGTLSDGCYILNGKSVRPWHSRANDLLKENKSFSGLLLDDVYVVGSIKNGVYFFDENGRLMQHLNRQRGLQNNTVLSLFSDRSMNIWLGLDNGIDLVKASLPVSTLNYNYNLETVYASIVYDGVLYVGTNQGLFAKPFSELQEVENISFEMVENTDGQVWNLSVIDDQLFCGHTNGAFVIEEMNAKAIYSNTGVWNFVRPGKSKDIMLSGTYDGIIRYNKDIAGNWVYDSAIEGIGISVRDLEEDVSGNFWLDHGYQGIYKLSLNPDYTEIVDLQLYNEKNRLPQKLPYFVHNVGGQLFFSTWDGIYQYNFVQDNFLRPQNLNDFYEGLGLIYRLHEDDKGNIWYFTDNNIGVYKLLEDGSYAQINAPFKPLQNTLMASFSNLTVYDDENIFIGTKDGLVHYNPELTKDYYYEISPIIKQVYISSSKKDSLWFINGSAQQKAPVSEGGDYKIPFLYNTLQFWYSSNDMENTETAEFRFRLQGYSDIWSEWTGNHNKEYTNLREGEYRFEVQARNIYGNVSEISTFEFELAPPFYRSVLAYIIYTIFFIMLVTFGAFHFIRRIEKVRKHEKSRQEEKFQEKTQKLREENLLAEQELVRLRNEKLRNNMKHKNKELANATYHIIQKNKFLNKLKNDLSALSAKAKSEWVERELKRISRIIDRDINHEQNWKVFNEYFDEVHQEFLDAIKGKHPDLTPKDLRLCAYLRMNISTKEIAPLLNISVRGVEISRYRLRKKLGLNRDANLTEYLLTF